MKKAKNRMKRSLSAFLSLVLICTMAGTGMTVFAADDIYYIDENGEEKLLTEDYTVVTSSDTTSDTTWESGWYVVNSDVTYAGRISVSGTVNLILVDGYTQTSNNQIIVKGSNVLNIYGQSEGTGTLTVKASDNRAGIGGDNGGTCGTVTINGGTIYATGGNYGAGIGGGNNGSGGTVTINGGTVTATGGMRGAGIGGGLSGSGGTITIEGGTVTATGGQYCAGIGGGYQGNGGTITIKGGIVTATGGSDGGAGIGGGRIGSGGTITINGGTVVATAGSSAEGIGKGYSGSSGTFTTGDAGCAVIYASSIGDTSDRDNWSGIISRSSTTGDAIVYGAPVITTDEEIPSGCTAVIEEDKTVTIVSDTTFTNNGTIYQDYGSTFAKEGTLTDYSGNTYYEIAGEVSVNGNTVTHSNKTYAEANNSITATGDCFGLTYENEWIACTNSVFTMPSEPVKLLNSLTLTYDANGLVDGTLPENVTITAETGSNKVTVVSGSGLGEDFVCWNTSADGSGTTYNEGDIITLTENITLYAQHGSNHNYTEDGFCKYCGIYQPAVWNETEEYYEIGNLGQFYWFMSVLNKDGDPLAELTDEDIARGASANGTLTADIGTSANPVTKNCTATYKGTFNGQGYTITMALSGNQYVALFATTDGATIENLYTAGTIEASGKFAASLVGEASNSLTIKKCVSSVAITSTVSGDGTSGGIVANLTSSAEYTIEDCAFTGSLIGTGTTSCGGIAGWVNGSASGTVENCWVTADLELSGSDTSSANIARNADSAVINCYYLNPIREGSTQGIQKTEEEFASGEVTWLLNGGVMEDGEVTTHATSDGTQAWYQNIDNNQATDNTPVLYTNHGTVYYGYNICDESEIGYTNYKETPAHTLVRYSVTAPSCTEMGYSAECWRCTVCGKCFSDENATNDITGQVTIPATGHDWSNAPVFTWVKNAEGYDCSATITCATDSSHTVTSNCNVEKYISSDGITFYLATVTLYDPDDNNAIIGTYAEPIMYLGIVQNLTTGEYYDSLQDAIDKTEDGETIQLLADICTDVQIVVAGKTITLDLNDCTIYNEEELGNEDVSSLISVQADENEVPGNLTIVDTGVNGTGSIESTENDVYACDVSGGSTLTIEAGTYMGNVSAVYVTEGSLVVNGGYFYVQQTSTDDSDPYGYVLDCDDDAYAAGTASIVVTGGSFVGFNPESCPAEGENTNLIDSSNYHSISTEKDGDVDIYTVSQHSYTVEKTVDPTCEEYGYTIYVCECGVEYETDWEEPIGHNYNNGEITTPATCGADGVKTYTCQNDSSHQYTEVIPATGEHTWGTEGVVTTDPACEAEGVTTYTCIICDATKEEAINPLGHNYSAEQDEITGEYLYVTFAWEDEDYTDLENVKCYATFTCKDCENTYTVKCDVEHVESKDHKASCTEPADYDVNATATITNPRDNQQVTATKDDVITGVALGHQLDEGVVTTEPTCMTEGVLTKSCTRQGCNYTETESIPVTEHSYYIIYEDEATCTTNGTYYYACKCTDCVENCGCNQNTVEIDGETIYYTYREKIDALGHSLVKAEEVPASCTEDGTIEYWYCTTCGIMYSDEEMSKELSEQDIIDKAKGHTPEEDPAVDPTCEETGLTAGSHCSECGEVLVAQTEIPALGHYYGEPVFTWSGYTSCEATISCTRTDCTKKITEKAAITSVTTSPNCTEGGQTVYTATVIFAVDDNDKFVTYATPAVYTDTKTEILDALGHTPLDAVEENIVGPTCTEKGSYESVIYCEVCGAELSRESKETDALGHTPLEAVEENVVDPTCTDKGSYESVVYCETCGTELSRESKETDALGHTPLDAVVENTVDPTCTDKGSYESVIYCETCDTELSRDTVDVDATGHTPLEAVAENYTEPTCTETGSYDSVIYCEVCGEEVSRTPVDIDALGHTPLEAVVENNIDPTCTEKGSYDSVIYCETCGTELSRDPVDVDATGHTPLETVTENYVEPTCTETGSYDSVTYCEVCGEEVSRSEITVNVLDHTEVTDEAVEPSCEETGLTEGSHCSVCGEILTAQEEIPALGHEMEYYPAVEATALLGGSAEYWYCKVCDRYYADEACTIEITLEDAVIPAIGLTPVEVIDATTGETIIIYLDEATGTYYTDENGTYVVQLESIILPGEEEETTGEETTKEDEVEAVYEEIADEDLTEEETEAETEVEVKEPEEEPEEEATANTSSISPQTGVSLAAIAAAMSLAAAGIVVVTRKKKEED